MVGTISACFPRGALALAGTLAVLTASVPAQAFINCVAHPLHPNCCPSPCPVTDFARLGDLVQITQETRTAVSRYSSMLDSYTQIWDTLGPNGTLAQSVQGGTSAVQGIIEQAGHLGPDVIDASVSDLRNPQSMVTRIKAVLEEPSSGAASTRVDRAAARTSAVAAEALDTLTSASFTLGNLDASASDSDVITAKAAAATDLRGDYAANTAARQALLETMVGVNDLLTRWAAIEAANGAASFPRGAGTPDGSVPPSATAASLNEAAATWQQLRRAKQQVQKLDQLISALTSLHNDRHAANVMLAQYPGLENTIRSHEQSLAWRDADRGAAVGVLAQGFVDPAAVFEKARSVLLSRDTTVWTDNTTKTAAASQASNAVVQAILADPERWGEIKRNAWFPPDSDHGQINNCGFICDPSILVEHFKTWLESDKLERFWHPLRDDADAAVARLDTRFDEIAARRGYDIRSQAAAEEEARLSDAFKSGISGLATIDTQDFTEDQVATINKYAAAMDTAADTIIADTGADTMVMVEWPK